MKQIFIFLTLITLIQCEIDQRTIFIPRVENYHPPKGYQPVKGYEPPNYKPNINNHIIFQNKPKVVNSEPFDQSYETDPIDYQFYNNQQVKNDQITASNQFNHPLLNLNRLPQNRYPSFVPINRPFNWTNYQNSIVLLQTTTATLPKTSTHRPNLPTLNQNNVQTADWRRTPIITKISAPMKTNPASFDLTFTDKTQTMTTISTTSITTPSTTTPTTTTKTSTRTTTSTITTTSTTVATERKTPASTTQTSTIPATTTDSTKKSTKPRKTSKKKTTKTKPTTISKTKVTSSTAATTTQKGLRSNFTFSSTRKTGSKNLMLIDDNCMKCLCFIESWCADVGCVMDQGSLSCGWYQLKYEYWLDCGQPGGSWKDCGNNKQCAETCVQSYLKRYGSLCQTGNTCADLARIHNGGPYGCSAKHTEYYGNMIGRCLKRLSPYENIDELYKLTFPDSS